MKTAEFADKLNSEYEKCLKSKAKKYEKLDADFPIRIYGSGDFIPEHLIWLEKLNFKFFIISKNLTRPEYKQYIDKVLKLKNITVLNMSFDAQNIGNYEDIDNSKIKYTFTGTPQEFIDVKDTKHFDTFFNINKRIKKENEIASKFTESCPADVKKIPLRLACTVCNKCWKEN